MSIFPLKLGSFCNWSKKDSSEFLIKFIKTLFSWSSSPLINLFLVFKAKFIEFFDVNLIKSNDLFINLKRSTFFKIGLGILAKFENSLTNFSMSLICLLIVSRYFSKSLLSLVNLFLYFSLKLSIDNWIGVKGFLISCASFLATLSQASYLSLIRSLSCCSLSRSIIRLKFWLSCLNSSSVSSSGTLTSNAPLLIESEAPIRLIIGFVNLDAKVIAIDVDKNNNKVTTII